MLLELIVTPLVLGFLLIAALGHVLLTAAIYQCLRGDDVGGRGQKAAARRGAGYLAGLVGLLAAAPVTQS
ncbi:MAG: hypothetical protein ACXWJR_07100 [Xanthobacteraceae bacterium]|jgi:hypothetical protein